MENFLPLNISLKVSEDIENVVEIYISTIQQAGWKASPEYNPKYYKKHTDSVIQTKIKRKIKLRKTWQVKRLK